MIKQNLSQKLLQKLSPQQIQLMKLLQIPTATLDQRIKEELEANPALEEGEEMNDILDAGREEFYENDDSFQNDDQNEKDDYGDEESYESKDKEVELDEYISDFMDDDVASYKLNSNNHSPDEEDKSIPVSVENTFYEYLEEQIGMLDLRDEKKEQIAKQIVGSIDEDGYLRREPASIVDDLMFSQNVFASEEEIEAILLLVQRFEPPGVGARDLRECLMIQLEKKNAAEHLSYQDKAPLRLGLRILDEYFEEFTKKHFEKLQRSLNVSEKQLKKAVDEILKLNPKPSSGYSGSGDQNVYYIVPDYTVVNRDGELELLLNGRNAPELRVSEQYKDMLRSYETHRLLQKVTRTEREAVVFIKQKIESARWFIDAIHQRQQTMIRTMNAILALQYDFFLTGDQKRLRPMILKDVAEITGLDISTVSRVANSKYVQTEFGIMRLKDFFSESLQKDDGEEVSTLEVKKILSDLIKDENKKRPLSDEHLKAILTEKGYNIARRTVAKYREQLNIPVARLRKEI
jgi:RNA polymerase sigma-54 factor